MRLLILIFTVVAGLCGASTAVARPEMEATVASESFDPKNPDCKCLTDKVNRPATHQPAIDMRVVEYFVNPDAKGAAPEIGTVESTK